MGMIVTSGPRTESVSWQVPQFSVPAGDRLAWIEEQILESEGWLSGQRSYINLTRNMRIFDAVFNDKTKSTLFSNSLKYNIRKFVETISDVREIGLFGSDAPQYKPFAEIENRVAKSVYQESQYPRQLRKALQYAAVMGVGYLWPKCKALDYGYGERRIIFEPLGLLDVLPIQVPSTNDVQDAYAVTVYEYMPIAEAHGRFPFYQSQLKPVDQSRTQSRLSARRLDWAEKFRYGGETRNWGNLYCEIRYTFIRDLRINDTNYELPMGQPDTTWFYRVPHLGQDIFGGIKNGSPLTRKAVAEDCRVYPFLRCMISSPGITTPMYDGPAFDWHGRVPIVQYTVDDWPWEAIGTSLVQDVGSIEQTIRKHERKMDQVITTKLNPPLGYDRTSAGGPKIENFDIFEENIRAGFDGQPREVLQSILPEEVVVDAVNFQFLEYLQKKEDSQLGINDLSSLENLQLNVSADSFDKALETIGPVAKGIAMTMEAANAEVAYMLKFMIPQWYDTARIIQYIGPGKIAPETFDYDPKSLIPSHNIDEYINGEIPTEPATGTVLPSRYQQVDRARRFAQNLRLISVPSTLLKITQMQEQLKYLQLYRGGFPIDPETVAEKLGIENWGKIDGDTIFAKWQNWERIKILLMAQAQQLAAQLGLEPPGGDTGDSTQPHAGGRPPTAHAAPDIKEKGKNDGNPRVTVTESK